MLVPTVKVVGGPPVDVLISNTFPVPTTRGSTQRAEVRQVSPNPMTLQVQIVPVVAPGAWTNNSATHHEVPLSAPPMIYCSSVVTLFSDVISA